VQLRAARLAEMLWEQRSADMTELASAASNVARKTKRGRDILADYKTVGVGQSAYFTGKLLRANPSPSCRQHQNLFAFFTSMGQ
jgi:hypothetical protein